MTPKEIQISYPFLFDDRRVMVKAYTQETTLGEKYETDSAGIGRINRPAGFMEKVSGTKFIWLFHYRKDPGGHFLRDLNKIISILNLSFFI